MFCKVGGVGLTSLSWVCGSALKACLVSVLDLDAKRGPGFQPRTACDRGQEYLKENRSAMTIQDMHCPQIPAYLGPGFPVQQKTSPCDPKLT